MLIPILFAAFGALCGLWLSIVGILATMVGLVIVCGVVSALFGGPLSPWMLFWSAVSLQLGYFATVATRIAVAHVARLRSPDAERKRGNTPAELGPDRKVTLDRR